MSDSRSDSRARVTEILDSLAEANDASLGTPEELLSLVYPELRRLAQRYVAGGAESLQATEVVHDAYLRLVASRRDGWRGRSHFFAAAATAMRHLLVDHARRRGREKHGGGLLRVTFDPAIAAVGHAGHAGHAEHTVQADQMLALDRALERLAKLSLRQARVVELRFFGGLKVGEVARLLGVSRRSVESDWTIAKAWLRRELATGSSQ